MKQTLQNRFPHRWLLLAFVLNFAIAAAALLPYMIRDGGLLLVAADFDAEQLSYNMLCNNAIKSGEVLWNWRIDIGSDFVSSFSFYTLGSPFFWLSFLFPASAFPYLVGWIYMLKYAVAGLTSFAMRGRKRRNAVPNLHGSSLPALVSCSLPTGERCSRCYARCRLQRWLPLSVPAPSPSRG